MTIFEGIVQIRTLTDSESCAVKFAHGHVDLAEFAEAAGVSAKEFRRGAASFLGTSHKNSLVPMGL